MFGLFFRRLLFVIFIIIEAPLVFLFFATFNNPNYTTGGIAFVIIVIFVLFLALNWIFSAFD